jgi:hypothetical protein
MMAFLRGLRREAEVESGSIIRGRIRKEAEKSI